DWSSDVCSADLQLAESSVLQFVGGPQLVGSPHYHLPPYLSLVTRHRTGALHRLHHPLYAASTTAVSIVVRDSCLEPCFFFLLSNGCNFQCREVQYFSQNLLK